MSERKETIKALKERLTNPSRLISENRESVTVYKDDLEALLGYVDELEAHVLELPDTVSELAIGDEVVSLIDYIDLARGMVGKVVGTSKGGRYPIEVQFEGTKFLYLKNGILGLKRDELAKVHK
jgi:hypothetical protein